jgi:hypothetical protein
VEAAVAGLNSNTFNQASVEVVMDSLEVLASEMLKTYLRKLLEEKILLQHSSKMMMISLEAMEWVDSVASVNKEHNNNSLKDSKNKEVVLEWWVETWEASVWWVASMMTISSEVASVEWEEVSNKWVPFLLVEAVAWCKALQCQLKRL